MEAKKPGGPGKGAKRCSRCQQSRPRSDYSRNAAMADGLAAYCRGCKREADRGRRRGAPAPDAPPQASPRPAVKGSTAEKLSPPARRGGRPSTITPALIEDICATLRSGHTRRVAASKAGVSEDLLATWMLRGREAKDEAAPTRQLYEAVRTAEGIGLMSLEEKAIAGAEIDHVQALRILERRHPEAWARRELKAEGNDSQQMEVDDVRKLLTERLTRFLGAAPPPTEAPPVAADGGATGPAGSGAT